MVEDIGEKNFLKIRKKKSAGVILPSDERNILPMKMHI